MISDPRPFWDSCCLHRRLILLHLRPLRDVRDDADTPCPPSTSRCKCYIDDGNIDDGYLLILCLFPPCGCGQLRRFASYNARLLLLMLCILPFPSPTTTAAPTVLLLLRPLASAAVDAGADNAQLPLRHRPSSPLPPLAAQTHRSRASPVAASPVAALPAVALQAAASQ